MRLRSSWAVLVGVVVALGVFAAPSTSAVTASECDTRANDTPSKLIPCIQTADLWNHMKAFQEIADQNRGRTAIRLATPASRVIRRPPTTWPT
jgi:hypothetical protein